MLTSAHASHLLAPLKQDSRSQIVPVLHFYSSPQPFPLEYAGPVVDRMMCGVSVSLMNRENKEGCGCYTMPNITVGTMGREAEASMETQCVCSMVICNPSCYEGERESRLGFRRASRPDRSPCQRWKAKLLRGGHILILFEVYFFLLLKIDFCLTS